MLSCHLFPNLSTRDKVELALCCHQFRRSFDREQAPNLIYHRLPCDSRYVRRLFVTVAELAGFPEEDVRFVIYIRLKKHFQPCQLEVEWLPNNLQSLVVDSGCNLSVITLPNSLRVLINRATGSFPSIRNLDNHPNLTVLDCPNAFIEHPIQLPAKLIYLSQTHAMPTNSWPTNVKVLRFGTINGKLDDLPLNLIELDCGDYWNRPFPKFPESLQTLRLGFEFAQPIELPANLTSLTITMPKQVQHLQKICQSLCHLNSKLFYAHSQLHLNLWPQLFPNLEHLCCAISHHEVLPVFQSVQKVDVILGEYPVKNLSFCQWPQLTHAYLEIWVNNQAIIDKITLDFPNSLVALKMDVRHVGGPRDGMRIQIPDNLTKLDLFCAYPFFEVHCGPNSKLRKLSYTTLRALLPTSKVPEIIPMWRISST